MRQKMGNLRNNLLSFNQNFMWLTAAIVGQLFAKKFIIPQADLSIYVLVGIVLGGNIGSYFKENKKIDERDETNAERSMAIGFMTITLLLISNLFLNTNILYTDILFVSSSIVLLVYIIREIRQLGIKECLKWR